MKQTAKLAFDMLEQEMVSIVAEELKEYRGGTGGSSANGGIWFMVGSGIWTTDFSSGYFSNSSYSSGSYGSGYYSSGSYNSGYYGSGTYGSGFYGDDYYGSGTYGSGFYSSGYYGSGNYGSGYYSSGSYGNNNAPDPGQIISSYVDNNGGWDNWSGGLIPGYGYLGPAVTIGQGGSSQIESSLTVQIENTVANIFNTSGLDASATSVISQHIANEELTSFSFKQEGNMLKFVGTAASGADIIFNLQEILYQDQTAVQYLEDMGQIVLNVVGVATEDVGIGFGINCILAVWEMDEARNGR